MRQLTWDEFDEAVAKIAASVDGITSVHGIPRGGLCLAVALSHRLGVPLVAHRNRTTLVVDDVVETGQTMRMSPGGCFWCWMNKSKLEVNSVARADPDEWLVFPWEQEGRAGEDEEAYRASRQ